MTVITIFTLLYLLISGLSLTLGYYAFSINVKSRINRLFFLLSLCMALCTFGFSIIIAAPDKASALAWMRVAAAGYTMLYSLLLDFTITLTGSGKLLKKWWIYVLIYAPATFCFYTFVISPVSSSIIYRIGQTNIGWARLGGSTVFDIVFNIYFMAFALISIILLILWRRRSDSAAIKKQGMFLIISIAVSVFTGAVIIDYKDMPLANIAPVLFLIPLGAIFYCIKRYRLMETSKCRYPELVLSSSHLKTVCSASSIGLIAGGAMMITLGYTLLRKTDIFYIIMVGVLPILMGAALYYARKTNKGETYIEAMMVACSLIILPVVTIEMADSGGANVWALPVIIMISSLVFNKRLALFSASASAIIDQIYLSGVSPQNTAASGYVTYIVRIALLAFIIAVSCYVHRIYKIRLQEHAEQNRLQTLLNRVSATFSGIKEDNATEKKRELINILAEYYNASRVCVCSLESEYSSLMPLFTISTDGSEIPPDYDRICKKRWEHYIKSGNLDAFRMGQTDDISYKEKSPWFFIPILTNDKAVGFMYFETAKAEVWRTKEQMIAMQVVSRIASGALEKANGEKRIWHMAYFDTLTKLPNRQLFSDRAEQAINIARRTGGIVGIMFLDLDSFKSVNDTLGHEGGDLLIKVVAEKLSSLLRKTDTVARFGGDEFLILLSCVNGVEDIIAVADKIMYMFKEPIIVKGQELFITASAGISFFPADGDDAQTLIKHADIAMYAAKENGKNQYSLCSVSMKHTVHQKIMLTNQLYRALENNELAIYYQPQISLQTGKIVGVEALLRWFNPSEGMIPPVEFIPLAEQTGLINPIGNWVLENACVQSVAWKRMGYEDIRMAVNLSVVQIRNSSLVNQVKSILDSTGIDPGLLELEVTESATLREPNYIVGVFNDLKKLGISISIDDFGTEYSSLNRLKLLPIDRIKMDIQFVHGIDKSPKDQAITMVIINLAKNLDLKLVAEGVETSSQLDFLKQRMCDEVQGYYYYHPMPASDIEKILESGIAI